MQYLTGYRADVQAIGEICHRHGVIYFVDAIQGLGVFPLDARACHIDALAADGHKWLLGPEGCAILYISRELQEQVEPVEFGWTNVAGYNDYGARDMALRNDAGRYECGTLNTIGCFGLRASMEFLLEVGADRMGPMIQALGDQIAEGARRKGYEVLEREDARDRRGNRELPQGRHRVDGGRRAFKRAENLRRSESGMGTNVAAFLYYGGGDREGGRVPAVRINKLTAPAGRGSKKRL